jgi:hypothetical protein
VAVLAPETLLEFPLGYEGINLLLDQGDTALVLAGMDNRRLLDFDPGAPDDQPLFAGSRDQDGDRLVDTRHGNRQVIAKVRMYGDTDEDLQDLVATVDAKLDKLRREGGELVVTVPSGEAYRLEVLAGGAKAEWSKRWVNHPRIDVTFEFTCGPYWMEAEEEVTLTTTMTAPCTIATAGPVRGSVPALGRLVVANQETADQAFAMWGLQSRTYDAALTAGLFYEAEDLTALGGAAAAVASGASGGDAVISDDLPVGTYLAVLSTGTLTHNGSFRIWARIRTTTPAAVATSIALEWATGDFRAFSRNGPVTLAAGSQSYWRLLDLGLVNIPDGDSWEGRVIVKVDGAVATGAVEVDCLCVMPVTEGYGEASGLEQAPTATTMAAQDGFNQTAGNLAGKTLEVGGTWAGTGDATDFTVNATDDTAERNADGDTAPRIQYVGSLDVAGVEVGATLSIADGPDDGEIHQGVIARYVDSSNYLTVRVTRNQPTPLYAWYRLIIRLAGTETVLDEIEIDDLVELDPPPDLRVVLTATPFGGITATLTNVTTGVTRTLSGFSSDLTSGGTLESGSVGLYDYNDHTETPTLIRTFDDFYAYEIPSDPAIFASQNLEVHHDRVVREHSTGASLTRVSRYAGDYLLVPVEGSEDRVLRVIIKTSRGHPADGMADSTAADDMNLQLFVTPRWLTLPASPA